MLGGGYPSKHLTATTRREFLTLAAGSAILALQPAVGIAADGSEKPPPATAARARISVRVGVGQWINPERRKELLSFVGQYKDVIDEIAFFTSFTHPPLPLAEIEARAAVLAEVLPPFKALGVAAGINHLSTLGHLDENLENSLREPWQHLVDFDGSVSASCYCGADPSVRAYIRACYVALAKAKPAFLWVDDDLRMESHGPIRFACFCERCVAEFSRQSGKPWTREALAAALRSGPRAERLALRRQWLAHNRAYLKSVLTLIREAVDSVDPAIPLGLMTGETSYSGYGFGDWVPALAGPRQLPVKWRPGGGFYTDDAPGQLFDKAHGVGRQIAFLPDSVAEIQYEHENFPYQRLKKSVTTFLVEIAAAIGAGCTGAALNCLGIADDPAEEFRPYFDGVRGLRRFFDKAVATLGRSPCQGVWSAMNRDHFAALQPDGDWFAAPTWGGGLRYFNEPAEIGVPAAYSAQGACAAALSGDGCLAFSRDELLKLLAGGVMLDVPALVRFHELGLGEHTGFAVAESRNRDTIERFTADPINGTFAGWKRDCRPSFYPEPGWTLRPLAGEARPLSEMIDFAPKVHGATSGVFENKLGGRVAVFGYYPWRSLQSKAKTSQIRAVCRWLSRDTLPAYVSSYQKMVLWCRRSATGRLAMLLLNASPDPLADVSLHVRGVEQLEITRALFDRLPVPRGKSGADGPYNIFVIPALNPWEPVLLTS